MTPRRPSPRRPSRRAGFTLVELMVAMVAGLIAIGAIYTLSAASARHFHEQQRVARTQSALRLAMNRLRHDFGRAGFLGTPNSTLDARCATQAAEVAAIDRFVNDDPDATAWLPNAVENGVSADSVVLTGNYASADGYLAIGLSGSGDTVFLQQNWQAFRRSFGVPFDEDAFAEVFRTGRLLRLRTQQGRTFILRITGINADRAAVRFTPALPIGGSCVVGLADGALVSPLSRIEYTVGDLSRDGSGMGANMAPADGPVGDDDVRGRTMSQLVRRELTAVGDDAVEGSARSLLDHVADFNLRFVYDLGRAAGGASNRQLLDNTAANVDRINNNPEWVSAVVITLSARTPEQDPRFAWVARADGDPLLRYRVNPELPGAARVRSLTSEVTLTNIVGPMQQRNP